MSAVLCLARIYSSLLTVNKLTDRYVFMLKTFISSCKKNTKCAERGTVHTNQCGTCGHALTFKRSSWVLQLQKHLHFMHYKEKLIVFQRKQNIYGNRVALKIFLMFKIVFRVPNTVQLWKKAWTWVKEKFNNEHKLYAQLSHKCSKWLEKKK